MVKKGKGARSVAHDVLVELDRSDGMADELLDRAQGRAGLDERDRALALELTYGVLRRQATLDWRLNLVASRTMKRLPAQARAALRLGAYQLLYLDRIPASAAVDESVKLVKHARPLAGSTVTGFVNAVLRSLMRQPAPAWPDPVANPIVALSTKYSCPSWLVERWMARYGAGKTEDLCQATLAIPPLTLRANTLKINREELVRELDRAGYGARPTEVSDVGVVLDKCGRVTELPQFQKGLCYVEDEAAQLVPQLLAPEPGERILDACAAPGGKATHLAALMQNRGEIVAMDRSAKRLHLLQDNCQRLGVSIIESVAGDLTAMGHAQADRLLCGRRFDAVLVDAPCSGLGVVKRHPEAKWQKTAAEVDRQQARQLALLHEVSALLRPGGRLVYSTCSTEPEENEQVIEKFCRNHNEFRRERVDPWVPDRGLDFLTSRGDLSTLSGLQSMDAFYACRLRKADGE